MVMYRARVQYLLKSIFDVTAAIVIFYVIMQLRPVRSSVCADGYIVPRVCQFITVTEFVETVDVIPVHRDLSFFILSEMGCLSPNSEFVFMHENMRSGMGVVVIAIRTRVS